MPAKFSPEWILANVKRCDPLISDAELSAAIAFLVARFYDPESMARATDVDLIGLVSEERAAEGS